MVIYHYYICERLSYNYNQCWCSYAWTQNVNRDCTFLTQTRHQIRNILWKMYYWFFFLLTKRNLDKFRTKSTTWPTPAFNHFTYTPVVITETLMLKSFITINQLIIFCSVNFRYLIITYIVSKKLLVHPLT